MSSTRLPSLLPAGLAFTSSGDGTESVWKRDIQLGWKALLLKPKQADPIENLHLGKMAVVEASIQNKALADFQAEPRRTSADPKTSTASCRLVERGDGVDVQIHAKSVAELIGDIELQAKRHCIPK